MSMHEFEDLVEVSVRLLDTSPRHNELDLRTMFWRLYEFQACWDTGFTHFRVMDILLKHRFAYRFEITQHPDYNMYKEYFDSLSEFDFIKLIPTAKWHEKDNPAAGYYRPPYLYCDAGSPLWQRFVDAGVLTGADAVPLNKKISLIDTAKEVVIEAERINDYDTIIWWYCLLGVQLYNELTDSELDDLKGDASLKEFLAVVQRTQPRDKVPPLTQMYTAFMPAFSGTVSDYIRALRELRDSSQEDL